MQIQCMLPEDAKTSFPWYENLILYAVFHLGVRHVLTNLLSVYRCNALECIQLCIRMHTINLHGPKCIIKVKPLKRQC